MFKVNVRLNVLHLNISAYERLDAGEVPLEAGLYMKDGCSVFDDDLLDETMIPNGELLLVKLSPENGNSDVNNLETKIGMYELLYTPNLFRNIINNCRELLLCLCNYMQTIKSLRP